MTDKETYMGAGKVEGCMKRMPECDLATERALAEGRQWKNELEKTAIVSNNELKMALASLAQSMTTTNEAMKTLAETVKADHELVIESQRQWREMQEWQKQQSVFRDTEEREKKEAIVEVENERRNTAKSLEAERKGTASVLEQERKDRIRPLKETMWRVIQWAVIFILGIIATAVWNQYFR